MFQSVVRAVTVLWLICQAVVIYAGDFSYTPKIPPEPSVGVPWPLPQVLSFGESYLTVVPDTLKFIFDGKCPMILQAFDRAICQLKKELQAFPTDDSRLSSRTVANNSTVLTTVHVIIDDQSDCQRYPYLGMIESYTLAVFENGTGLLRAPHVWGVLRGLETFTQLSFVERIDQQDNYAMRMKTTWINDWPRFQHRGLLLDTSRHFLSMKIIKKNLELMSQTKYNVFHWHIVDDQSFPYVSDIYPNLSISGAYTADHIYTKKDIAEVVEFARVRGIRVMPEFDTPGHTMSFGKGAPEVLSPCYVQGKSTGDYGVMDPSRDSTYQFIKNLFVELGKRFPDQYVHIGGDEVFFDCWRSNMGVEQMMEEMGINISSVAKVEDIYIQKLLDLVAQERKNGSFMVWQEVFDNSVRLPSDAVVQVWMGKTVAEWDAELERVTKAKFRAILSSCWYLNYIAYGNNWENYYACDPQHFTGTQEQKDLVIGGESCMWGEWIDNTNLLPTLWPRASVVAERLWSDASVKDVAKAKPRLEEHRCRLVRRGYPASPVNGPGHCVIEWDD